MDSRQGSEREGSRDPKIGGEKCRNASCSRRCIACQTGKEPIICDRRKTLEPLSLLISWDPSPFYGERRTLSQARTDGAGLTGETIARNQALADLLLSQ